MALRRRTGDRTLVDVATRDLRERILSGGLGSGTQLVLADLAEEMSVSVMPVREAIGRLQAEGLVEQVPHRGARVSGVSVSDLEDLYRVRVSLETLAVRLAAERLTEGDYERLSGVLGNYLGAYSRGDEERGREAHAEFHLGLYELSGSSWLMRTIPPLWDAAGRYQRMSRRLRGSVEERHREHEAILEHCYREDPDAASAALEEHLGKTLKLVRDEITEPKDPERS